MTWDRKARKLEGRGSHYSQNTAPGLFASAVEFVKIHVHRRVLALVKQILINNGEISADINIFLHTQISKHFP